MQENNDKIDRFKKNFQDYLYQKDKHMNNFINSVVFGYEERVVYRCVHSTSEVVPSDFLCNIDEADFYGLDTIPNRTQTNFATSVNESIEMLRLQIKLPHKKKKLFAIAKGIMKCKYGPADFDEDRPHHNWYLYSGSGEELCSIFKVEDVYGNNQTK